MNDLNSAIKATFGTFRTDLSGIRVKKILKLVRTVQLSLSDICSTVQVFENGHSICISPVGNHWELVIDQAVITLDQTNVYDNFGNETKPSFLAPAVIQTILTAA